jgi:exodeoxyribonuclease VII small subunit
MNDEPTKTVEPTYEAAVARLEQIIARLDSGEAQLRETLELCREAKALIEFARSELDEVSGALRELKLDELVEQLDSGPAAADPPSG